MAERRMLSRAIIGSDEFLDLGFESRALYLQLLTEADDDGFVGNVKKQLRVAGATQNGLSELTRAKFIIVFPTGVAVICHWNLHNRVRRDRYRPTVYTQELARLTLGADGIYRMEENPDSPEQSDSEISFFEEGYPHVFEWEMLGEEPPDGWRAAEHCEDGSSEPAAYCRGDGEAQYTDRTTEDSMGDLRPTEPYEAHFSPSLVTYRDTKVPNRAYVDSLTEEELSEYRRLTREVMAYFRENRYISSAYSFIIYNEQRGWRGIGGDDVKARYATYADMWEDRELMRCGLEPRNYYRDWRPY